MNQRKLLVIFSICYFIDNANTMSEAQVKAAGKMVRNVCQPKTKATNEDIDKMHVGDWNIQNEAKCYMNCVLNMQKLLNKDNSLNFESGLAQLKQLPESLKASSAQAMENCKNAAKTLNEKCEAAYELSHCFYDEMHEKYFLP